MLITSFIIITIVIKIILFKLVFYSAQNFDPFYTINHFILLLILL